MKNHTGKLAVLVLIIIIGVYAYYIYKSKKTDNNIITIWTQPDARMQKFWKIAIKDWNDQKLGMKVVAKPIPQAKSSEEAVLTSLAAGTAPDICDNIFIGFASQLAHVNSIYELDKFKGYNEVIKSCKLQNMMKYWEINGKSYVIPLYCSPIMYWWNMEELEKYGISEIPRTYSDVYKLAEKCYVPFKKWPIQLNLNKMWNNRWADFIAYYYAASGGQPYVQNGKACFNNQYGADVLTFFKTIIDRGWTKRLEWGDQASFNGQVIGVLHSPGDIEFARINYPGLLKKVKLGTIPVPDNYKGLYYSAADSKGLVILKTSKHPEEAWAFLRWLFSNEKYSLLWLESTGWPPYRGDLETNPIFKSYFEKEPMVFEYAKNVKTAVPCAPTPATIEVQQSMTNYIIEPLLYKTTSVANALKKSTEVINDDLKPYYKNDKE